MHLITARNVHTAFPELLLGLELKGYDEDSRNGPVRRLPGPTAIEYELPEERVLFWQERDANPFFHLFECLWMIAGKNDVKFVSKFSSNIANYSDDGKKFHGAYGFRWRRHFGFDQLDKIISQLKANPLDRRSYMGMWDPKADLGQEGKDFPCNLGVTFNVSNKDGQQLDMCVFNRSNDAIWGALGANAVHFSFLHEYVARSIGVRQGTYTQISSNMHAYHATLEKVKHLADQAQGPYRQWKCPYEQGVARAYPIMQTPHDAWYRDLLMFMAHGPVIGLNDPFFRRVVTPLWHSFDAYLKKEDPERFEKAIELASRCEALDWQLACVDWLKRREANTKRAKDDGVQQ